MKILFGSSIKMQEVGLRSKQAWKIVCLFPLLHPVYLQHLSNYLPLLPSGPGGFAAGKVRKDRASQSRKQAIFQDSPLPEAFGSGKKPFPDVGEV